MDAFDQALELIVREWVTNEATGLVELIIVPETTGGPLVFQIKPKLAGAAPIQVYVADDGKHISFSVGERLWWDGAIELEKAAVTKLLNAIATGATGEQIRRKKGEVVAYRGYVQLDAECRLETRNATFYSIWPGIKWEPVSYRPYKG